MPIFLPTSFHSCGAMNFIFLLPPFVLRIAVRPFCRIRKFMRCLIEKVWKRSDALIFLHRKLKYLSTVYSKSSLPGFSMTIFTHVAIVFRIRVNVTEDKMLYYIPWNFQPSLLTTGLWGENQGYREFSRSN